MKNILSRRWIRFSLISILALVGTSLIAGISYEGLGRIRDSRAWPLRGQMVDVGGYRLNLLCSGHGAAGEPVMILDSGLGQPGLSWQRVQQGIARFARVCSYDRAGYGRSDAGPNPRSSLQIAKELHTLLHKAQIPGPYLLVGHSFGGYNVRVFTGLFRNEVAGMVLADASHEDQERFLPASARAEAQNLQSLAPFIPVLRFLGVLRLRDALQSSQIERSQLPPKTMKELSCLALRPHFLPTVLAEYALLSTESAAQVRASGSLGNLPLVALTAGEPTDPQNRDLDSFRNAWLTELQPALARLSTRGRQIMVIDSDHMIPYKDPGAVVDAVRLVLNQMN